MFTRDQLDLIEAVLDAADANTVNTHHGIVKIEKEQMIFVNGHYIAPVTQESIKDALQTVQTVIDEWPDTAV